MKRVFTSPVVWRSSSVIRKAGCFVLTYHRLGTAADRIPHLDADLFRRQMEWVRANCDPIEPQQLRTRARNSARARPAVLVTFDDAYPDFYEHAYPVVRRLRIPTVCFVPTDYVDRGLPFWWDLLHAAVEASRAPAVFLPWAREASPFTMDARGRAALLRAVKAHVKQLPDAEKDPTVAAVLTELQMEPASLKIPPSTMTWDQVRSAMDIVTFGGHTHTHAIMPVLSPERLDAEVTTCRDRLEQETGVRPTLFAYPSGAFDERVKAAVRRGGFDLGFSTLEGVNGPATDWLEIRRIHGPGSVEELAWRLTGIPLEMATTRGSGPA